PLQAEKFSFGGRALSLTDRAGTLLKSGFFRLEREAFCQIFETSRMQNGTLFVTRSGPQL
ncbi:hypothetical protein, partial [Salmonella enterica]|uniref:hypothetical protein n=1 Tax=Salmonella enterica TaxID=28901 RepID=UPI003CE87170